MKMLAATKVSGSKKSEQKVRHFLHKTCSEEVSGMFTLQSCKTTAKKCTKKSVLHEQSAFLLIRPIVVFSLISLPSPLIALHDFIFSWRKL